MKMCAPRVESLCPVSYSAAAAASQAIQTTITIWSSSSSAHFSRVEDARIINSMYEKQLLCVWVWVCERSNAQLVIK